jgi:amino acid adenylation domain-containing protein
MHRYLLSSLIPDAASSRPDAIAVVCGDESLTWSILDRRVGRLAAALRANGVNRGDRVGIYLHKSIESMVAVHGVLRAGAAYVPIDPLAPADLVASIVADCGIEVLITHQLRKSGLRKLVPKLDLRAVVGAEAGWFDEAIATSTRLVPWVDVDGIDPVPPAANVDDDLAYVMYTSGSTGKPKGIMHTHRSGLAYAEMAANLYGLGPHDRTANFSPLHFDMSTFEILAAPANAATAVLIPEPYLRVPASLTQYLSDHRVTTMYTVPSLFMQMMSRGAFAERDWSAVRWVMPAGEVFPPEPLRQLMALVPQARFSNVYGPAEVNQCTFYHLPGPLDDVMPLGQASPGAELDLVDSDDNSIDGPGTGELIVRTSTMMAGYWNRPDLDAKGFLHRSGPGGMRQRWYRTGDVVRRDRSGQLTFLGRSDNQVKIRGYRVELEVVEAAVGSLPGIEQAVVGPRPGPDGDAVLVARYVPASGAAGERPAGSAPPSNEHGANTAEPPLDEWRSTLVGVLPGYAVPSAFEAVTAFPRTPSGKIDRRLSREAIASVTDRA